LSLVGGVATTTSWSVIVCPSGRTVTAQRFRPDQLHRGSDSPLFCSICGSCLAWEVAWVAGEREECEGDEGFGSVEAERDAVEESDLGVGRLDEGVGEPGVEGEHEPRALFEQVGTLEWGRSW
jgi:hypothetical protein